MLSMLLADDHAIVRQGLKVAITEEFGEVSFGEAESAHGVLHAVQRQDWDAVILDIRLPDKNGLEVLKEIKGLKPSILVVMLSMHPEEQYALRALKAGAAAYLTKESAPEELVAAVRKVVRGGRYVSSTLADLLAAEFAADATTPPHHRLSDREYEVLLLIAGGKTLRQAADELSLSAKTVSTYRARLLRKLNLKTTVELVRYSFQHGLAN